MKLFLDGSTRNSPERHRGHKLQVDTASRLGTLAESLTGFVELRGRNYLAVLPQVDGCWSAFCQSGNRSVVRANLRVHEWCGLTRWSVQSRQPGNQAAGQAAKQATRQAAREATGQAGRQGGLEIARQAARETLGTLQRRTYPNRKGVLHQRATDDILA